MLYILIYLVLVSIITFSGLLILIMWRSNKSNIKPHRFVKVDGRVFYTALNSDDEIVLINGQEEIKIKEIK